MDRVTHYRQIIHEFLIDFTKIDVNSQLILDAEHDRYLAMHNEWQNDDRIYGCAMQFDIIEGQIWIQHNSTEIYVDRELIQRGVAPQDIIFGFRSPSVRKLLAIANHP
jgi:hypothetical protein